MQILSIQDKRSEVTKANLLHDLLRWDGHVSGYQAESSHLITLTLIAPILPEVDRSQQMSTIFYDNFGKLKTLLPAIMVQ